MPDEKGQLVLSYTSTSEVIDQVDYGSLSGLVATNAYVEENNLDSLHLRVPLKAIQREEISKPAIGFDPANFGTGDLEVQVEPVYNQDWFTSSHERRPGCKVYEMKNHLGNVLATVSDWKIGADTSVAGSVADYYLAEVRSLTDYLPFGMEMPGRVWSGADYRYGFQGQEGDDEWSGSGNSVFFKYRVHDPRVGRFLSVDPLAPKYPFNSQYAFSENRVLDGVELEGLEVKLISPQGEFLEGPFSQDFASKTEKKGGLDISNVQLDGKKSGIVYLVDQYNYEGDRTGHSFTYNPYDREVYEIQFSGSGTDGVDRKEKVKKLRAIGVKVKLSEKLIWDVSSIEGEKRFFMYDKSGDPDVARRYRLEFHPVFVPNLPGLVAYHARDPVNLDNNYCSYTGLWNCDSYVKEGLEAGGVKVPFEFPRLPHKVPSQLTAAGKALGGETVTIFNPYRKSGEKGEESIREAEIKKLQFPKPIFR